MSLAVPMYAGWEKMRRFAQMVFPPWVRTYPKSTSARVFVPAQTKIAVKLLNINKIRHRKTRKMLNFTSFWPTQACTVPEPSCNPGEWQEAQKTWMRQVILIPWAMQELVSQKRPRNVSWDTFLFPPPKGEQHWVGWIFQKCNPSSSDWFTLNSCLFSSLAKSSNSIGKYSSMHQWHPW